MLRDACLLRGVQHSNIKSVSGIFIEPGLPPLLVYHFDNDCNLKIYLQLCRTAQVRSVSAECFRRFIKTPNDICCVNCPIHDTAEQLTAKFHKSTWNSELNRHGGSRVRQTDTG